MITLLKFPRSSVGVHWIQNFAIRPDPDPCRILTSDPAGSGSEQDPSHLDPAGSKPQLLLTTGEKLFFLHHNWKSWNDCLPFCDQTST